MKNLIQKSLAACLALFLHTALGAESAREAFDRLAPITNVDHRETTSLNGQWNIIVDPYEAGFYNYRYV